MKLQGVLNKKPRVMMGSNGLLASINILQDDGLERELSFKNLQAQRVQENLMEGDPISLNYFIADQDIRLTKGSNKFYGQLKFLHGEIQSIKDCSSTYNT